MACGILVPQPETEPSPSAVRTQSPNHWTTSKFLLVPLVSQRYKGKKARSEGFVNCDSVPTQHGRPSDGWKVLHLLRQLCKVTLDSMWEFKSGGGGTSIHYRGTVSLMYLFDSPKSGVTREGRTGDAEMSYYSWALAHECRFPEPVIKFKSRSKLQAPWLPRLQSFLPL